MNLGVKYKSEATETEIEGIEKKFGLTRIKVIKALGVYSYQVEKDISGGLKRENVVEYVEQNREFTPMKD
jgi:hypothetical protein